jgi:hypothetical protein
MIYGEFTEWVHLAQFIQFLPFHCKTRMIDRSNLVCQNNLLLYIYSTNHVVGHYGQGPMYGQLGDIKWGDFFLHF